MAGYLYRAEPLHPGTAALLGRGMELLELQQWEAAASHLAAATPDQGGVHFLSVDPLIRLGRFREAVAAHRQAVVTEGPLPPLPEPPAAARFALRQTTFWT